MSGSLQRWLHHPLTRNSAFMHLWAGQTAAQVGFQVGTLATSAIAITVLHATETQIGILSGLQTLAFLLVGLPAGAWVDGWRKRRVMIAANLARIAALVSIPIAYVFSSLALTHLMVVAAILGLSTVFFDVAYQSYVPMIASKRYIGAANGRLEASYQVGRAGGPGLGGWLLDVIAPPLMYLLTASTYVCSTWAIWRIRTPEPRPAHSDAPLRSQILEGLFFVRGQRLLFPLFSCIACAAFAGAGAQVLLPILVLRTLGMSATQLGLLLSAGAIGGILGALTRPLHRFNQYRRRRYSRGPASLRARSHCSRMDHCCRWRHLLLLPDDLQRHPDEPAPGNLSARHARSHERDLSLRGLGRHAPRFIRSRHRCRPHRNRGCDVSVHRTRCRRRHRNGLHSGRPYPGFKRLPDDLIM